MKKVFLILGIWLLGGLLQPYALYAQTAERDDSGVTDIVKIQTSRSKTDMNPMVAKAYVFKNVRAGEMFHIFSNAAAREAGSAETNGATNSVIVTCPPHMIPFFDNLHKTLDIPGEKRSSGKKRYAYVVRHRDASVLRSIVLTAANGITSNHQGTSSVVAETDTNRLMVTSSPANEAVFNTFIEQIDIPVPQIEVNAKIVEVETRDGGKLGIGWDAWKDAISGGWTWGHSHATSKNRGEGFFRNNTTGSGFGNAWGDGGRATYFGDAIHESSGYASANGYSALLSVDASILAQMLNYTIQKGDGKILTEAKVTVRHNQQGLIDAMTRIPFYGYNANTADSNQTATADWGDAGQRGYPATANRSTFTKTASNGGGTLTRASGSVAASGGTSDVHYRELALAEEGVRLAVTPVIGTDSSTLNVNLRVNSMVGWSRVETPIIHSRTMSTQINVVDGKTFSLGGLKKNTVTNDVNKIPLLGSIPYMGYLFKTETKMKKESVVFAFVQPKLKNLDGGRPGASPDEMRLMNDAKQAVASSVWGYDDFRLGSR